MLAMLRRAGMADDVEFFTYGAEGPDVEGAMAVADKLGLHFNRYRWPAAPEGFLTRFTDHVERVGGEVGCWESSECHSHPGLTFSGLLGETLRSGFPKMAKCRTEEELERLFRRLVAPRVRFLQPEIAEIAIEEFLALVLSPLEDGHDVADLADIYFLTTRQRRWIGPSRERYQRHVFPLYTGLGVRTAFGIGASGRVEEQIRRALMSRAELLDLGVAFGKRDRTKRADFVSRRVLPAVQSTARSAKAPARGARLLDAMRGAAGSRPTESSVRGSRSNCHGRGRGELWQPRTTGTDPAPLGADANHLAWRDHCGSPVSQPRAALTRRG